MPEVYTRNPESDLCKWIQPQAKALDEAEAALLDFSNDITVAKGCGEGLDWTGENHGIARPPGMSEEV
jgi:hypothetical protein